MYKVNFKDVLFSKVKSILVCCLLLIFSNFSLHAVDSKTYKTLPTEFGSILDSGYYIVSPPSGVSSVVITPPSDGSLESALVVKEGATVTIEIPNGVHLDVLGRNGSGQNPGGAGIHVPESSTLIITGSGSLSAVGGNAAEGANGGNGGNGKTRESWHEREVAESGDGGLGGAGGGGAGAGIGGIGGYGGDPTRTAKSVRVDEYEDIRSRRGTNGYNGDDGWNGENAGNIFIYDSVTWTARGGSAGPNGSSGSDGADMRYDYVDNGFLGSVDGSAAGGGGAGAGGHGGGAASDIGGGGPGGGSGPSGGSGCAVCDVKSEISGSGTGGSPTGNAPKYLLWENGNASVRGGEAGSTWGADGVRGSDGNFKILNLKQGRTSAVIDQYGIIWLQEESGGTSAWYGIDNTSGVFEIGSVFWVKWLDPDNIADQDEYQIYFNQLDDEHKQKAETNKLWIFLTGVTDTNGNEYSNLNSYVPYYVQIGEDWDREDVNAWYISHNQDEPVNVLVGSADALNSQIGYIKFPDASSDYARLLLKHFSPYTVYDSVVGSSNVASTVDYLSKNSYSTPASSYNKSYVSYSKDQASNSIKKTTGEKNYVISSMTNKIIILFILSSILILIIKNKDKCRNVLTKKK